MIRGVDGKAGSCHLQSTNHGLTFKTKKFIELIPELGIAGASQG